MPLTVKVPTIEEFNAYDGAHTKLLWRDVGPDWVCPACARTKYEILRWTTRFPGKSNAFKDWIAPLHKHHDHSGGRFPETIVCDQCNSTDGAAKRKNKLPKNFSFAPHELAQFIKAAPHTRHVVDHDRALNIFKALDANRFFDW